MGAAGAAGWAGAAAAAACGVELGGGAARRFAEAPRLAGPPLKGGLDRLAGGFLVCGGLLGMLLLLSALLGRQGGSGLLEDSGLVQGGEADLEDTGQPLTLEG